MMILYRKSKYARSETKYQRWIKEVHDDGYGSDYLPWFLATENDAPSTLVLNIS
jgi:hypothetical protein